MALTDDRPARPRPVRAAGDAETGTGAAFDRQPPQDLTAEQSVLGGMLLSKDAIADVVEVLRPDDFYRPAHQTVYDCILDLYGRGEPADAVTVSSELHRRGDLIRLGGAPYLHTLIATVPTAANAAYYAEIVAEKAILRRLVEAGTRIVQLGYHGANGAEVNEVVDRAQAAIYDVTERSTSEDYVPLEELLQPTMDEIDAIASRGGVALGVPTGFVDLDAATNGLHPGQMIVVAARPGLGKALALDTALPTPSGWTTMGEVAVGDELIDAAGMPTTVVAATEVMHRRPCFEVVFCDGSVIVADAEHQWLTDTMPSRRDRQQKAAARDGAPRIGPAVHTTGEIAATLRCATADSRLNHSVDTCAALLLPNADLLVQPYTLGVWLGDDASAAATFTSDACHDTMQGRLRTMGVLHDKHIPVGYRRASLEQRRELLAGLMDANGTVTATGDLQFCVTSRRLAADVRELVASLGYRSSVTTRPVRGRRSESAIAYTLNFTTEDEVFRLDRKRVLHKERYPEHAHRRRPRYISDVRPVPSVPVRCVQVANEAHLYLAGRGMVPTHNSTLGLDFARSCSVKHGLTSAVFSLEMSRSEIVMRLLSAEARIRLADMRAGRMSDGDWTRMARRMSEISEAPLFIDDSPNLTLMEIRAKSRRLKQRHDLKLVVLDYLQLMTSGRKVESRQQEVSEFSRQIKLLAKELEVPIVAISQLNRGPEQRTDKRPMLADLRESGCLTAGTRLLRADTGAEVSLGELLASGERGVRLWSLDERMRMVAREMTAVFPSGVKEVFRLRLASGREVEATANHPFRTIDGWCPLGELSPGDRLATPRRIPAPECPVSMPEEHVVLLAHLVGDGTVKSVPAAVFALPDRQVALFLRHLWATDGPIPWDTWATTGKVYFASTSRLLVEDVARLLLRIGVLSRQKRIGKPGYRDCWQLHLYGAENQLAFLRRIGAHRMRNARVATVLPDAELEMLASSDVCWDEIVEIAGLGKQPVYDATVPGTHNFVADGIVAHNSIEQDSDMVILLHRPDAFERDDPRAGEADLILAKHRNGPTSTITVAHQLHYSRFADLARS